MPPTRSELEHAGPEEVVRHMEDSAEDAVVVEEAEVASRRSRWTSRAWTRGQL
jgi:hypothetical protein